jgi:flagellar hook-associated protein 1 FlgK
MKAWLLFAALIAASVQAQAGRMAQVQQGVLEAAQARRDGVSGVNLDEEMSDMVRFQKSYNAAARMVTTLDEMLDTIISRMGVVGR